MGGLFLDGELYYKSGDRQMLTVVSVSFVEFIGDFDGILGRFVEII